MRKKIVAGNWKMNMLNQSGKALVSEVMNMVKDEVHHDVQVLFFPPNLQLTGLVPLIQHDARFGIGAQNCHKEEKGAFTGEISPEMLKDIGATHVILGHSERRSLFGETNSFLAEKVNGAFRAQLNVVFCCGETLEERKSGSLFDVIRTQIVEGLFHLEASAWNHLVVAYEPVWAIGTGETASKEQAQEMHAFIRQIIIEKYGQEVANQIRILYGGSVKADNAEELFSMPDIDGGLIGGASLQSRSFTDIIKAAR